MVGRMILVFNVRLTMITSSNKRQLTSRKKIVGSRAMIVEKFITNKIQLREVQYITFFVNWKICLHKGNNNC